MKRYLIVIISVLCLLFINNASGFLLPQDNELIEKAPVEKAPGAFFKKAPDPFLSLDADIQIPSQPITQEDISNLVLQIVQQRNPSLEGAALAQSLQDQLATWLSLEDGIMITELTTDVTSTIATRDNTTWTLKYNVNDANQGLTLSIVDDASDFNKFNKIRFSVKGDTDKFRLSFGYFDSQGDEQTLTVKASEVIDNLAVNKDSWNSVELNLAGLIQQHPEVNWDKVRFFGIDFKTDDFTEDDPILGLPMVTGGQGKLYVKDLNFTPQEGSGLEDRLFSLDEIATILRTALLGAEYDLGKERDFNLVRYIKDKLKTNSEAEILAQFRKWNELYLTESRLPQNISEKENEFLRNTLRGNFEYFNSFGMDKETGLPYDYVIPLRPDTGFSEYGRYTKVSNIGLTFSSLVAGIEMGLISKEEAAAKINKIFETLDNVEVYEVPDGPLKGNKYLYEGYDFNGGLEGKLTPILNRSISSIDTAWFLAGLVLLREEFKDNPEIIEKANYWIANNDLRFFYDDNNHLFKILYRDYPERGLVDEYPDGGYPVFSSETRILSYLALGLNAISDDEFQRHWEALERTKLSQLDLEYEGMDLVPSFGGSAFEFGMPALFVDEVGLNPYGQGINIYKAMVAQKLWAENQGYPLFGESPCVDEKYGYDEFGSPPIALSPYHSRGVVTAHALFMFPFDQAIKNLRTMAALYPESYLEEYGFASAVNTNTGEVIKLYRPLEQGMIVPGLANLLKDNVIQKIFLAGLDSDKITQRLGEEKPFFSAFDIAEEITVLYEKGTQYLEKGIWRQADTLFDYIDFLDKTYQLNFDYKDWREEFAQTKQLAQQSLENLYTQATDKFEQGDYAGALAPLKEIITFDVDYLDAAGLYKIAYTFSVLQQK